MKKSMRNATVLVALLVAGTAAAAQSPYPTRSFAEKFDCRSTGLPQFTGQVPNADMARQMLTVSGAKKLRWILANEKPGSAKKGRVTAQLDVNGRVATAFCG